MNVGEGLIRRQFLRRGGACLDRRRCTEGTGNGARQLQPARSGRPLRLTPPPGTSYWRLSHGALPYWCQQSTVAVNAGKVLSAVIGIRLPHNRRCSEGGERCRRLDRPARWHTCLNGSGASECRERARRRYGHPARHSGHCGKRRERGNSGYRDTCGRPCLDRGCTTERWEGFCRLLFARSGKRWRQH